MEICGCRHNIKNFSAGCKTGKCYCSKPYNTTDLIEEFGSKNLSCFIIESIDVTDDIIENIKKLSAIF